MLSVHCGNRRLYEGEMDQVRSIRTDEAVSLCVVETVTLLQWICVSQIFHIKATWYGRSSKYTGRGSEAVILHIRIVDTRRMWVFVPSTTGRPVQRHRCLLGRKLSRPEYWSGRTGGDKSNLPLPGIEPQFFGCPAHSLVTEPAMKDASVPT
jgi:hypothetical protein